MVRRVGAHLFIEVPLAAPPPASHFLFFSLSLSLLSCYTTL